MTEGEVGVSGKAFGQSADLPGARSSASGRCPAAVGASKILILIRIFEDAQLQGRRAIAPM